MNKISFEDCFKKHYPSSYTVMKMIAMMGNTTIEEHTLTVVQNFDGSYELEDSLMGAFIMHIAKGNINGIDIDKVINDNRASYIFTNEFINDVKNNLI